MRMAAKICTANLPCFVLFCSIVFCSVFCVVFHALLYSVCSVLFCFLFHSVCSVLFSFVPCSLLFCPLLFWSVLSFSVVWFPLRSVLFYVPFCIRNISVSVWIWHPSIKTLLTPGRTRLRTCALFFNGVYRPGDDIPSSYKQYIPIDINQINIDKWIRVVL